MKTALIFPGQGAQTVTMGMDIASQYPAADEIFNKSNDIVGYDLKNLCFQGPQEELNKTTISQPAIFVTSAAILEVLKQNAGDVFVKPDVTAGLSLGEYTALYAAGVLDFESALSLVQKRGIAMQAAADASDGSMVSILGLDAQQVEQICTEAAQGQLLSPANFNCPGQIVISGAKEACQRSVDVAEKAGAIKAIELQVAGAFHTSMMAPAAEDLKKALDQSPISDPGDIKIIANIDGAYYTGAESIRQGLVKQLIQPILWQKCMENLLSEGYESFYEIGPGRVLTGLMKRIHRKTKVVNVSDLKSLQQLLN